VVLTVSGARQEVNQLFISICVPLDGARYYWVLMGSHALGMRASTACTVVIGKR